MDEENLLRPAIISISLRTRMYCFQCRLYVTHCVLIEISGVFLTPSWLNTVFMYFFLKERFVRDTKQLIGNSYITAVKGGGTVLLQWI